MSDTIELSREEIASGPKGSGTNSDQATFPFEAMKLKVGDRLQIQPPPRLAQDRVIVRLIGYLPNTSLLVTAPTDGSGLRLQLLEKEKLVVRVFSAKNAFGFSTTINKITKIPFEYLHLEFPNEVQGMVIRTAPRIKTKIIATVNTGKSEAAPASALIANISANGAMLDATRVLADKGDVFRMAFRISLHGFDSIIEIDAAIRAITPPEDSKDGAMALFHHGIQFVNLQQNDSLLLQSMIYQQMVEHPETVI